MLARPGGLPLAERDLAEGRPRRATSTTRHRSRSTRLPGQPAGRWCARAGGRGAEPAPLRRDPARRRRRRASRPRKAACRATGSARRRRRGRVRASDRWRRWACGAPARPASPAPGTSRGSSSPSCARARPLSVRAADPAPDARHEPGRGRASSTRRCCSPRARFAVGAMNPLTTCVCLLLLFYTVESLERERHDAAGAIAIATPVRTGSILLGKALAQQPWSAWRSSLAVAAGRADRDPATRARSASSSARSCWSGGCCWCRRSCSGRAFVMAVQSLTRNRYATYAIAPGRARLHGLSPAHGRDQLGRQLAALERGAVERHQRPRARPHGPGPQPRCWRSAWRSFFLALTVRFYPRREADATPDRPAASARGSLLGTALRLAPVRRSCRSSPGILAGARGRAGASRARPAKKLPEGLLAQEPRHLPRLAAARHHRRRPRPRPRSRPEPAQRVDGTYDLVNNRGQAARRQIPLTGGLHWEIARVDARRQAVQARRTARASTSSRRRPPLAPGGKARLGFRFEGSFPGGISKNGGGTMEFILPSGVVLTSFGRASCRSLGFMRAGRRRRREHATSPRSTPTTTTRGRPTRSLGARTPVHDPDHDHRAGRVHAQLGGARSRATTSKDGRRTAVWESDQPVNFFNVVAGRWEVRRGEGTAVYYHPGHPYNVDEMVEALDAARKYYSEWFRPYPWKELKLSEFPALATYAQGFPTNITFSEGIGFLTESDPEIQRRLHGHRARGRAPVVGQHARARQGARAATCSPRGWRTSRRSCCSSRSRACTPASSSAKRIEDSYAKSRQRRLRTPAGQDRRHAATATDRHLRQGRLGLLDAPEPHGPRPDARRHPRRSSRPTTPTPTTRCSRTSSPCDAPVRRRPGGLRRLHAAVVLPGRRARVPRCTTPRKRRPGRSWKATAPVENIGTGTMPVEVAAVRGRRFDDAGQPRPDYREARATVTLGRASRRRSRSPARSSPNRSSSTPTPRCCNSRGRAGGYVLNGAGRASVGPRVRHLASQPPRRGSTGVKPARG